MKKRIILFCVCIGMSFNAFTQISLTQKDEEQIACRIRDRLDDFQMYLNDIADKRNSRIIRTESCKAAKQQFIGDCESYSVTDIESGQVYTKDPVRMETASTYNGKMRTKQTYMKNYLDNLLVDRGNSNIIIEKSQAVRVDNFRKVGNGRYEAVAHFYQMYTRVGGEKSTVLYKDMTEKDMKVYINIIENDPDHEVVVEIKLGDVAATNVVRLK